MAIFGKRHTQSTETPVVAAYEGYVEEGLAGLQMIVAESAQDSFQLRAGMYISDVIMEESVLEGAATPEILMESFVKDSFGKLKGIIEKLWAKVRAWFEKAKKNLQIFFTSGAKFIEKFKSEIEGKTSAGFTYEGFHYTLAKGNEAYAGKENTLKKTITEAVGNITSFTMEEQHSSIEGSSDKHKDSFNHSEEKEKVVKALGGEDMSAVLKELHKAYRGGKESKEEIKDFAANSKAELISFVADSKKAQADLNTYQKDIDGEFARVIKAITAAKGKIEGTKVEGEAATAAKGKQLTFAQHKIEMAQFALTVYTQLIAVNVDAVKEAARASEGVLKSFLRYKPAKENFVPEEGETGSILESAMRFI